jgi:hypothetical protein
LALLVIFLLLIAAAAFLDRPQATATPLSGSVTPTLAPLWTLNQADITEVRIEDLKNKDVSAVDLRKDPEGKWVLFGMLTGDSRLSREANQDTVTSSISQIAQISPSSDFGENLNLPDFGLDRTGYLLTVKTSDGITQSLEVARDLTPSKTGFYIMIEGSKRVYTVPKSVLQSFVDFLLTQPVLATVTPPPATETVPSSESTPTETGVLPTATATPAP